VRREDLLLFAGHGLVVIGVAFGIQRVQDYLNGDWAEVADCRATFWTCEAEVGGKSRIPRTEPVVFAARAKACGEYRAYETALRRATFECSMSRSVLGGSCKEIETKCALPDKAY
jgi:hypothetical protein